MTQVSANELVTEVERRIADGDLRPGDRLPTVRAVAAERGVAPNTVAAAYRRLRDRGAVTGRGRQGTVVADRPLVVPVVQADVPAGVVDAMTGNPDASLLPDIEAAMGVAVRAAAARYGGPLVVPELEARGRELFEHDGVDAGAMTVVSGAMDAVERLLGTHLRQGDRVGVEDPGYASVHQVVHGLGLEAVPIAADRFGVRPDALAAAMADGLDALIVTPRANNPCGAAFDEQRVAELDDILAANRDLFVIQDDHAGPIAGVPFVGLRRDLPRWAVVRSMAKSLGPDLRVALVVGDADTIGRVEARIQIGPGWVSHLLQHAAASLLSDPRALAAVEQAAATYTARRERLAARLAAAGIDAWARSGLQVWVPVPDEQAVVMAMLERGFAIRAGDRFRLASPPAVRVTIAGLSDDDIDALADALVEVLRPAASTRTA